MRAMDASNAMDNVDQIGCHSSDSEADCDVFNEDPIRKVLRGIGNVPTEVINKIRCARSLDWLPWKIKFKLLVSLQSIGFFCFGCTFSNTDVKYANLSALNEEDLKMFGIVAETKQKEIVAALASCMHQENHFDKYAICNLDKSFCYSTE